MEKKLETTTHDDDSDRISNLPEHIIHHIMEFLPTHTAAVTRMSVLSKKFFSFWCSFPVLDFCAETILSRSKVRDTESVLNSIQYTFQHRRLSIRTCLQRLDVRGFGLVNNNSTTSTRDIIHEMVNFAIQKQVKQLHLYDHYNDQLVKLPCFPEPVLSTKSITILTLYGFSLEAQHLTLSLPLIETFHLFDCSGIKSIILSGEKLRHVEFIYCYGLEKIQVDGATSLDVLRYGGSNYCDINLASNKSVKRLEIQDTLIIHDKWFNSDFCRLIENLKFYKCTFPVKTRWYFDSLKRLELDGCGECKVEFETPNLEWFKCRGCASDIPLLISSRRFDAELHPYKLNVPISMEFRMPLKCQTLTLFCCCAESLICPRAMRAGLNPQLHDIKHLKIECVYPKDPYNIVELIDSLLWLAPHPNTISFIDHKSQAVLKSIKFNYHDATSKNANCFGLICGVECWRLHLKNVELHKFEDVDGRASLQTYFSIPTKLVQ